MKNKIEDLRNHLFAQLELLGDDDILADPEKLNMQLKRARGMADLAGVIIESAKVEVQFLEAVGGKGSGFMPYLPEGGTGANS